MKIIEDINNKWSKLRYVPDLISFNKKDYWQTPLEFLENGKGDCEDFAIAKYFDLKHNGIDSWLVYCIDKRNNEYHMVCFYDGIILDINKIYNLNNFDFCPFQSIYGFNDESFYNFFNFKIVGKDLGVYRLSKWIDILNRI